KNRSTIRRWCHGSGHDQGVVNPSEVRRAKYEERRNTILLAFVFFRTSLFALRTSITDAGSQRESDKPEVLAGGRGEAVRIDVAGVAAAPPDLADEAGLHERLRSTNVSAVFDADL